MSDKSRWQAPKPFGWRRIAIPTAVILLVAATAAATFLLTRVDPPAPPAPPPAPTAHALSPLEISGINGLLERQRTGAHKTSGTIIVSGRTLGVQLAYTDDNKSGSGVVTAGGTRGEALLDNGVVYLRGDSAFWTAIGVAGPPPAAPGWVNIGPTLLEGKLFYAPSTWTAALAPIADARLDGDIYRVGKNIATIGPRDITHYDINGVNVDVTPANGGDVTAAATQLGADHGPGAGVTRTSSGGWTLAAPAPPAEPSSETTTPTPTP